LGVKHAFENDLDQVSQMIDVNVKGVFTILKAFLPGFMERKKGDIINISSVAGLEGYPGGSGYCATKHAVQGLTEALRKEVVATPLRICSICPGLVETEFSQVRFGGDQEKAKNVYKGIEALTAADVADTVAYVVSRPAHVQISDLVIMPTNQAAPTVVHRNA
ncbi:short-chain dehydrogenase/reductase SDR, partial [Planoprotostelium fungivorum]